MRAAAGRPAPAWRGAARASLHALAPGTARGARAGWRLAPAARPRSAPRKSAEPLTMAASSFEKSLMIPSPNLALSSGGNLRGFAHTLDSSYGGAASCNHMRRQAHLPPLAQDAARRTAQGHACADRAHATHGARALCTSTKEMHPTGRALSKEQRISKGAKLNVQVALRRGPVLACGRRRATAGREPVYGSLPGVNTQQPLAGPTKRRRWPRPAAHSCCTSAPPTPR